MDQEEADGLRSDPALSSSVVIDISAGLSSGVIQAGLLNPWDRALYLSVKDSTAFLSRANWNAPYHGFSQAVVGRAISGALLVHGR